MVPASSQPAQAGELGAQAGELSAQGLVELLGRLSSGCRGRLGVAAHRLGTDERASWHAEDRFRTASTVKVAVHAAV
jgi:beta-lactamase class A